MNDAPVATVASRPLTGLWRTIALGPLERRLFWIVVAGLLPLVLLSFATLLYNAQTQRRQQIQAAENTMRSVIAAVDAELRTSLAALDALAASPRLRAGFRWVLRGGSCVARATPVLGEHRPLRPDVPAPDECACAARLALAERHRPRRRGGDGSRGGAGRGQSHLEPRAQDVRLRRAAAGSRRRLDSVRADRGAAARGRAGDRQAPRTA